MPCDAVRPARFSALAIPFLRRISPAFSMSPPASSSARLQSIMPAPVRARSSLTSFGEIVALAIVSSRVQSGVNSKPPLTARTGQERRMLRERGPPRLHPAQGTAPPRSLGPRRRRRLGRPPSASVLSRAAMASGFGRRFRRGRRRLRSSLSPSLPASVL